MLRAFGGVWAAEDRRGTMTCCIVHDASMGGETVRGVLALVAQRRVKREVFGRPTEATGQAVGCMCRIRLSRAP